MDAEVQNQIVNHFLRFLVTGLTIMCNRRRLFKNVSL